MKILLKHGEIEKLKYIVKNVVYQRETDFKELIEVSIDDIIYQTSHIIKEDIQTMIHRPYDNTHRNNYTLEEIINEAIDILMYGGK